MGVRILVDGLGDVAPITFWGQTELNTAAQGQPNTGSIVIRDFGQRPTDFVIGRRVTVDLGEGTPRIWGGYLLRARRGYIWAYGGEDLLRKWTLVVVDNNILFSRRITYNKAHPEKVRGPKYTAKTYDDTVIATLHDWLDLSDDGIDFSSKVQRVASIVYGQPAYPWNGSMSWGEAMTTIAQLPAAIFYLDPDWRLVYADVDDETAPRAFSDTPEPDDAAGYRECMIWEDGASLVNDALAWGFGAGVNKGVFSRLASPSSIALHGLWQRGEVRYNVWHKSLIKKVTDSIVNGSPSSHRGQKIDVVSVDLVTHVNGFRVGMAARFINHEWGVDDVIPIRSARITFETPDHPRYELRLSHALDRWGFEEPTPIEPSHHHPVGGEPGPGLPGGEEIDTTPECPSLDYWEWFGGECEPPPEIPVVYSAQVSSVPNEIGYTYLGTPWGEIIPDGYRFVLLSVLMGGDPEADGFLAIEISDPHSLDQLGGDPAIGIDRLRFVTQIAPPVRTLGLDSGSGVASAHGRLLRTDGWQWYAWTEAEYHPAITLSVVAGEGVIPNHDSVIRLAVLNHWGGTTITYTIVDANCGGVWCLEPWENVGDETTDGWVNEAGYAYLQDFNPKYPYFDPLIHMLVDVGGANIEGQLLTSALTLPVEVVWRWFVLDQALYCPFVLVQPVNVEFMTFTLGGGDPISSGSGFHVPIGLSQTPGRPLVTMGGIPNPWIKTRIRIEATGWKDRTWLEDVPEPEGWDHEETGRSVASVDGLAFHFTNDIMAAVLLDRVAWCQNEGDVVPSYGQFCMTVGFTGPYYTLPSPYQLGSTKVVANGISLTRGAYSEVVAGEADYTEWDNATGELVFGRVDVLDDISRTWTNVRICYEVAVSELF